MNGARHKAQGKNAKHIVHGAERKAHSVKVLNAGNLAQAALQSGGHAKTNKFGAYGKPEAALRIGKFHHL